MKLGYLVVALPLLVASCAAHDESSSKAPTSSSLEPIATTPRAMDAAPSAARPTRALPDWVLVEKELGDSSYGQMYTLEVDVDLAGSVTTLRSPQFERKMAEVIRT